MDRGASSTNCQKEFSSQKLFDLGGIFDILGCLQLIHSLLWLKVDILQKFFFFEKIQAEFPL